MAVSTLSYTDLQVYWLKNRPFVFLFYIIDELSGVFLTFYTTYYEVIGWCKGLGRPFRRGLSGDVEFLRDLETVGTLSIHA